MGATVNPFSLDVDRGAIWEMLVERDIVAFLARDWSMVEGDFIADGFFGLHAHGAKEPDAWTLAFPELPAYREEWLRQAAETAAVAYAEPLRAAIFRATDLSVIEIAGDHALARKKFDGVIARLEGGQDRLDWQTLYICARRDGRWKIASFVGYLPRKMGA
jgi:ketosteroid isomerase-like protein